MEGSRKYMDFIPWESQPFKPHSILKAKAQSGLPCSSDNGEKIHTKLWQENLLIGTHLGYREGW